MTSTHLLDHHEPALGYGQLFKVLWRRLPWFLLALSGSLGVAVLATLFRPPVYKSSMQLLVEPNVSRTLSLNDRETALPNSPAEIELDYVTQLNLMRSKQFVEQAIAIYPDLCKGNETGKECLERFQEALTLMQVEEDNVQTRIFEVMFVDNDDYIAMKSLEALQRIYLTYNQEQQANRLTQGLALVNQQIERLQQDLRESQQALQAFRQAGGTIDPEEQSLEAASALVELQQVYRGVQADYQEAQAQYDAVQQALAITPQQATMAAKLSQSTRYQALLDALQASELALSERLAVYTAEDPIVQDLQAQRDRQVTLLQQESQRLLGSAETTSESELLSNGQLGENDLALVQEMINVQIEVRGLAARAQSLGQQQLNLQQQLDEFPALIAEYDRLQPDVESQRESLELLLQTRQELSNEIAQGGFKWEVVESPDLGEKIAPELLFNLAVGAIAGIFLGGLLAYSRESTDMTIRTYDDLQQQTPLSLLGILPRATLSSPVGLIQWEPYREAVDLIYKNIQLAAISTTAPIKSVMVTSAIEQEGKTSLAMGLALSAARSQQRVLLVDADLRNPSVHQQLDIANHHGLTHHLSTGSPYSPIRIFLADVPIDVLPAGPLSSDPVRLLKSRRMKALASELEDHYDLVVFDASSLLGRVDALQMASLCSGVVMVNRLDQVNQTQLSQAAAALERVNTIGTVANSSSHWYVSSATDIRLTAPDLEPPAGSAGNNGAGISRTSARR